MGHHCHVIASVSVAVEADHRVTIRTLASHLGLVKKSARGVPTGLSDDLMVERVRTFQALIDLVVREGKSVLDQIITITMDESAVSMRTPETKQQSKQGLEKGIPWPVKAMVHATRAKTMVMAFLESQGDVYTITTSPKAKLLTPLTLSKSCRSS
jgi:hypothetical protein